MQVELVTYFYFLWQRNTFNRENQNQNENKKEKGLTKQEEKVNFCSIIKRKRYSLYFDTGLFQKWQKTSYSKNNNVFNEYRQYNSCRTLQLGLNLSTAKRMTFASS
jgi:hypothetical protein